MARQTRLVTIEIEYNDDDTTAVDVVSELQYLMDNAGQQWSERWDAHGGSVRLGNFKLRGE